jgi:hypothetical protein
MVPSQPGQISNTKRTSGVVQGIGPEFKPQYHTHTKKKKRREEKKEGLN